MFHIKLFVVKGLIRGTELRQGYKMEQESNKNFVINKYSNVTTFMWVSRGLVFFIFNLSDPTGGSLGRGLMPGFFLLLYLVLLHVFLNVRL